MSHAYPESENIVSDWFLKNTAILPLKRLKSIGRERVKQEKEKYNIQVYAEKYNIGVRNINQIPWCAHQQRSTLGKTHRGNMQQGLQDTWASSEEFIILSPGS